MGRNGAGKTTMLQSLLRNAPGVDEEKDFPIDGGTVPGATKSRRIFLAGSPAVHR